MKKNFGLSQKVFLACFGIIMSLVVLEALLRLGGFFFLFIQRQDNLSEINSSEIRILCIGESTTALGGVDSYPAQLEDILNQAGDRRFKVINAGMVSKTSGDILRFLPQQLEQYEPDIIVSMLGINDQATDYFSEGAGRKIINFINQLRTVHLFDLLSAHMRARLITESKLQTTGFVGSEAIERKDKYQKAQSLFNKAESLRQNLLSQLALETDPEKKQQIGISYQTLLKRISWILVEMGRVSRLREEYPLAIADLEKAIIYDSSNYGALVEIGRCFKEQNEWAKAIYFFDKALEQNSKTVLADMEKADCLDQMGMHAQAAVLYEKIVNADYGDTSQMTSDIAKWFIDHGFDEKADKALETALSGNSGDYALYKAALAFYEKRGESDKVLMYQEKAASLAHQISSYFPHTIKNYNDIVRIANDKKIPVICMQYPLRSIDPLKEIFWTKLPDFFVENKINFKTAMENQNYFKLFSDSFAGDFGHCTRKGNKLIAENLADAILAVVSNNKNKSTDQ